ncbi:MAG: DMT family transporter [Pseudomonadota bacterium]
MSDQKTDVRPAQIGNRWLNSWTDLPGNVRGGLLYIAGLAVFAVVIALIKLAGEGLHVTQILLVRQATMVLIAVPVIVVGLPDSLRTTRPMLQFSRIVFAFLAMVLGFSSLIHLGLAETIIISFSKAFFTTLLAIFLLNEIVRRSRWVALVLGFAGVLVVVWPEQGQSVGIWHLAAMGSAICVAVVTVYVRILAQVDKPVSILTYQALGVGILMLPFAIWNWQAPTIYEWGLLACIGALSVVAQYLNILAMKYGEASAIAPLEYTLLVFGTALGWWLFTEWPDLQDWIGAAIIVGSAIYVLGRERKSKPKT